MRQFKNTLRAYGGSSTVHGVPYILDEGQHPLEKMLWIFLVGIGCWVVAHLSLKIYDDWQTNPVITTVSTTGYSIKNIPYPSVTICAQGSMREITGDVNYLTYNIYYCSLVPKERTCNFFKHLKKSLILHYFTYCSCFWTSESSLLKRLF